MGNSRRDFLGRLAAGTALAAGAVGASPGRLDAEAGPRPVSDKWDMSWCDRITGKFRGVFDSPKLEDGGEIFRAAIWQTQVTEVYGVKDEDVNSVLVIRHGGIPLAMDDAFWARHQIGKKRKVKDPWTGKTSVANPIRSYAGKTGVPPSMAATSLEGYMARGGIVLACNFAFGMMVHMESELTKETDRAAVRTRLLSNLVPGIILQPSGFFALLEAQRAGCHLFAAGE
jgi:hypothetical protein